MNGTIHQPLLSRSRSRLIVVAARVQRPTANERIGDRVEEDRKQARDPLGVGAAKAVGDRIERYHENEHPADQEINSASQSLARLMRPSKLNRSDVKPMVFLRIAEMFRGLAHQSRGA